MTAAVIPAGVVPSRPAWRSLLWIAPLTLLWILLIYWLPIIPASGVQTSAHQLVAHGVVAVGLWLGLEGAELTPAQRRTTWLAVMVPDTLWFAVAWSAAINGAFLTAAAPLPVLPLAIFLPVIIGAPLLLVSKRAGQVLNAMPPTWLVALQGYRVFGSWMLGSLAAWDAARGVRFTGGNGRRADRSLRCAGGARGGGRYGSGATCRDRLEYSRSRRFRRRDHHGDDHLARPVPVDRSGCVEPQRRRLSRCADPRFCGAELDPAARAVAAPTAPPQPKGRRRRGARRHVESKVQRASRAGSPDADGAIAGPAERSRANDRKRRLVRIPARQAEGLKCADSSHSQGDQG